MDEDGQAGFLGGLHRFNEPLMGVLALAGWTTRGLYLSSLSSLFRERACSWLDIRMTYLPGYMFYNILSDPSSC